MKFSDNQTNKDVIENGSWTIGGQPFFLKPWTTNLIVGDNEVGKVPIWVKFHGIPLEYWTPQGLSTISSAIGIPLYMENITELGERLEFAKICVDMDIVSEFKEVIELELPNGKIAIVRLDYAWKPI